MALTFTDALTQLTNAQTINTTASNVSGEVDNGANTYTQSNWVFITVTGFAAAPAGNKAIRFYVQPLHASSGTLFDDGRPGISWPVAADVQYDFAGQLGDGLPRYFKGATMNDTSQNTDDTAVSTWVRVQKVTV